MDNKNLGDEILAEVKKISQLSAFSHKQNTIMCRVIIPLFVLVVLVGAVYTIIDFKRVLRRFESNQEKWSWYWTSDSVDYDLSKGNLDQALEKAKFLITKAPNEQMGYKWIGFVYLSRNELKNAKESFEKAYMLFPSEQNEKNLEAINKRIEKENGY